MGIRATSPLSLFRKMTVPGGQKSGNGHEHLAARSMMEEDRAFPPFWKMSDRPESPKKPGIAGRDSQMGGKVQVIAL